MKDADFQKESVRKGPEKEVVIQKEISIQSYPIYVEKPVPYLCLLPWIRPFLERGVVWSDSTGYLISHSSAVSHP